MKNRVDKKTLLEELSKLGKLEKEHQNIIRDLIALTKDPRQKQAREISLELLQPLGRDFVRSILQQSLENDKLPELVDAVKKSQAKVTEITSTTRMEIAEKKKKKKKQDTSA